MENNLRENNLEPEDISGEPSFPNESELLKNEPNPEYNEKDVLDTHFANKPPQREKPKYKPE